MKIRLDYSRNGLEVELPDGNLIGVLRAKHRPPLDDPAAAVEAALDSPIACLPLSEIAMGKRTACVVVCDITRPVPNTVVCPPILRKLEESGIRREDITILIATGMHRPCTEAEILEMLGPEIVAGYRIVNHLCEADDEQVFVGNTSRGVAAYVDRTYMEADIRIIMGLIEPHFMAGFSGGRKLICPGISSIKTVQYFHCPEMLEQARAATGVIDKNPVHEMALEVAWLAGVDFSVNVVIDEEKRITNVFAGELEAAHLAGVRFVADQFSVPTPAPADIVVTSSAGYPLDATFYQTVKGMFGALPVVKQGGVIIIASGIEEGIGGPDYTKLQKEFKDPDSFLKMVSRPGFFRKDQWQVQMFARTVRKAEVWMYCEALSHPELESLGVTPLSSVEDGIAAALGKFGSDASILAIPSGPYVMPEVGIRETSRC